MRLDNTLLDTDTLLADTLLSELHKKIPDPKSAQKTPPNALDILQRKIKEHYFGDKKMSNEDALNKINSPTFNDFPRLKYVLHEILSGNNNIEIPETLKDWEPNVSFESLNQKYGYFNTDLADLFNRLAIACRKMTSIIEHRAHDDEMAYKLAPSYGPCHKGPL